MSAGGRFSVPSTVLAWNPQTDIYEYGEKFVKAFLQSKFNFSYSELAAVDWKERCKVVTDSKIKTDILHPNTLTNPRRVVYLQNSTDWHRARHLQPLWAQVSSTALCEGINALDSDHVVFISQFADGHNPPSTRLIGSLLSQLMKLDAKVCDLDMSWERTVQA